MLRQRFGRLNLSPLRCFSSVPSSPRSKCYWPLPLLLGGLIGGMGALELYKSKKKKEEQEKKKDDTKWRPVYRQAGFIDGKLPVGEAPIATVPAAKLADMPDSNQTDDIKPPPAPASSSHPSPLPSSPPPLLSKDTEIMDFQHELSSDSDEREEEDKEYSASPYQHPSRPLEVLTASLVPSLIHDRTGHVLVQVYAPWCGACKQLSPVVNEVAKVMKEVQGKKEDDNNAPNNAPTLRVFSYDGEANHYPGLLVGMERHMLPLLKFYPSCGSKKSNNEKCQPVVYKGEPNVEGILNWLHGQCKQSNEIENIPQSPFDLEFAHLVARLDEPTTFAHVSKALSKRLEDDFISSPSLRVNSLVPCGKEMGSLIEYMIARGYRSYEPAQNVNEQRHGLFVEYQTCAEKRYKDIKVFWDELEEMVKTNQENVRALREKLKQQGKLKEEE